MNTCGQLAYHHSSAAPRIGSLAHFGIFVWALLLVALTTGRASPWILLVSLLVLCAIYPKAIRRLAHWRWLFIFATFFGLTAIFGEGKADQLVLGAAFSSENMLSGLFMIGRALIILLAADGLASSIDIIEVAGLFERIGFSGLGFSLGVAVNMIPNLRESIRTTWHSLKMRGGLRSQWRRGIQLFVLTVMANALRRSEEIVLAAEVRAFSPERARRFYLRVGRLDWLIVGFGLVWISTLLIFTW